MTSRVEFTELAPGVYVAGQLEIDDIERVVSLGVKTLVCNRPDGEADQINSTAMAAAAKAAGLSFVYMPMASVDDATKQSAAFREVLASDDGVMAYCRSGRRSTILWQESTK